MNQLTLRAWRVNAGFSRKDVAELIGKTARTIYNWEAGLQIPDKGNLDKLAEIYQTSSDFIFLGDSLALSGRYHTFKSKASHDTT